MVRCVCCDGFCTVWWYLVLVLCWRGDSFCLLRRLLSSMPQGRALVFDALVGEPSRCCAGNGTGGFKRASLRSDSATRPFTWEAPPREVRDKMRSCLRMAP